MKFSSDQIRLSFGKPISLRTEEKPKPCTRPNRKLTAQRRETAYFGNRFSAAT
ncbi:hypothetical protein D3C83_148090 [compost metagenome]